MKKNKRKREVKDDDDKEVEEENKEGQNKEKEEENKEEEEAEEKEGEEYCSYKLSIVVYLKSALDTAIHLIHPDKFLLDFGTNYP